MRTIYIDSEFKCHIANDGAMHVIETNAFDGRCDAFIEGCCFIPDGESWTREDGEVFEGESFFPWKDDAELEEAQITYERQQLEEYKNIIAEQDLMILDLQYNSLIE